MNNNNNIPVGLWSNNFLDLNESVAETSNILDADYLALLNQINVDGMLVRDFDNLENILNTDGTFNIADVLLEEKDNADTEITISEIELENHIMQVAHEDRQDQEIRCINNQIEHAQVMQESHSRIMVSDPVKDQIKNKLYKKHNLDPIDPTASVLLNTMYGTFDLKPKPQHNMDYESVQKRVNRREKNKRYAQDSRARLANIHCTVKEKASELLLANKELKLEIEKLRLRQDKLNKILSVIEHKDTSC